MRLLSIDTETTGLNPITDQVLEIGVCVFDPQPELATPDGKINASERRWQTWECLIGHTRITGDPYAIGMNADLINEIAGRKITHVPICNVTQLISSLRDFLQTHLPEDEKYTIVGKNYDAFDAKFLERIPGWNTHIAPMCARRTLDAGSLLFCPDDGEVVNLKKCLERVGYRGDVPHRALDDACLVATVVSRFFA